MTRAYGRICRHGHKVVGKNARKRGDGYRCYECMKRGRVRVTPEDGVKCRLCGDVMHNLGTHLPRIHGITSREYRERFPGAALVGPNYKGIRNDITRDKIEDGSYPLNSEKQSECEKGHPMRGGNIYVDPRGRRQCRRCMKEQQRSYHQGHGRGVVKARAQRPENIEKNRERARRFKAEHPERWAEIQAKSRKKRKAKIAENGRRWREANAERKKANDRAYYLRKKAEKEAA